MNAKVQTRFVTQIKACVLLVVKDLYLKFTLTLSNECSGCNSDSDCKGPNQKCDFDNKICRPKCSEADDCKDEVCDEVKGLCVPGNK